MKKNIIVSLCLILLYLCAGKSYAQGIAIKTNVAGWAMFAPNVGVDLCVSESSSVEAVFYKSVADSWFKSANFTALQLGYRYWFDREPLNSFFCGATVTPGTYQYKTDQRKYKGDCLPFGVNIGYCLPLTKMLNLEISYGIGATYLYDHSYSLDNSVTDKITHHKFVFSPTDISINISYIIK